MARGNGTTTTTTATGSAKTVATPARIAPVPAKILKQAAVLGEPGRFPALAYIAAARGAVTLADLEGHLGPLRANVPAILDHLKRKGWVVAERIPAGGGGPGWRYRLSDAGRERLMALGG
jgi:DNA-binding MarR family transcriptional regulator